MLSSPEFGSPLVATDYSLSTGPCIDRDCSWGITVQIDRATVKLPYVVLKCGIRLSKFAEYYRDRDGKFSSRIRRACAFRCARRRRSDGFSKYCLFFTSFVRFSFSHSLLNRRSICPADSFCLDLIRIAICVVAFY